MRVLSWNVNGLRAIDGRGSPGNGRSGWFRRWIERQGSAIVGAQEARARREQLPRRLVQPRGWHVRGAFRPPVRRQRILSQRQRQGSRQQPRALHARLLPGAVRARLTALRAAGQRVLVMGDFNTAHRDIDLARPRQNLTTSGFLPEERAELDRWIGAGWVDTFRQFEAGPGHYTWWSQRFGVSKVGPYRPPSRNPAMAERGRQLRIDRAH